MPERIQLSRRRGWKKPPDAVVVSRPSRHGNPYYVTGPFVRPPGLGYWTVEHSTDKTFYAEFPSKLAALTHAVDLFALNCPTSYADLLALRGHDLACWCPTVTEAGEPHPCHAAILLARANP